MSLTKIISSQLAKSVKSNPVAYSKYRNFADSIWSSTVLTEKEKETIAVAVTSVTKCSFCSQFHTEKANKVGVTTDQLVEAIIVSTSVEAGSALLPSLPLGLWDKLGNNAEELFEAAFSDRGGQLHSLLVLPFQESVGKLSTRVVVLIAYSVAHALRSDAYVVKLRSFALKLDITEQELIEASLIAAALRAGSTTRHIADITESLVTISNEE